MVYKANNLSFGYKNTFIIKNLNFSIPKETLTAIVGKSGSGKSTLCKLLLKMVSPTNGSLYYQNKTIEQITRKNYYRDVQFIFQNPFSALNPSKTVSQLIEEPLKIHQDNKDKALIEFYLNSVGLSFKEISERYPIHLSGGQCQRVAIARALACKPKVLICDEPFSALDYPFQRQIFDLLIDLKKKERITLIIVTHDLELIQNHADQIIEIT